MSKEAIELLFHILVLGPVFLTVGLALAALIMTMFVKVVEYIYENWW